VIAIFLTVTLFTYHAPTAHAQDASIDMLNAQIKQKKSQTDQLDSLVKTYNQRIKDQQNQANTLQNQIDLLENLVKEKELTVQRTQSDIEATTLEIQLLDKQIAIQEQSIATQKDLVARLIRNVQSEDQTTAFDILLAKPSLSDFFDSVEQVKSIERDLGQTVSQLKDSKTKLNAQRKGEQEKQAELEQERKKLRNDMLALESEVNYKASLIQQTKNSEKQFQKIIYELRQQEQDTSDEIANLESKLKARLQTIDDVLARGDEIFSWPVDPNRGITAIFHDPTYPFKNLFQHPGTDIRASKGTPIHAAAGGYVAWNKTSRSYGNYTMIIHPGGFATVYAHLSKFMAKPDTFVERGDVIGLSGGQPGDQGAGLSTGPHVHFEIRQNGIPTDPERFLPQVPNDYYDSYDEYKQLGLRI